MIYPASVNSVSQISSDIVTFNTFVIFIRVSSEGTDFHVTMLLTDTFDTPIFSAGSADMTFLAGMISFNCNFIKCTLIDYFCKYMNSFLYIGKIIMYTLLSNTNR